MRKGWWCGARKENGEYGAKLCVCARVCECDYFIFFFFFWREYGEGACQVVVGKEAKRAVINFLKINGKVKVLTV